MRLPSLIPTEPVPRNGALHTVLNRCRRVGIRCGPMRRVHSLVPAFDLSWPISRSPLVSAFESHEPVALSVCLEPRKGHKAVNRLFPQAFV